MDMGLVDVERVMGHRTSATIVPRSLALPAPLFLGRSRIARGIRRLRRHSQTKKRVCSLLLSTAARDSRRSRPRVSDGTRTRDILDHNQVLYQLSYTHHASGPIMLSGPRCAA